MAESKYKMVPEEELRIDPLILEDGQTIWMTRKDPFGMIYLSLAQGTIPEKYSGAYSRVEAAQHAALTYAEEYKTSKVVKTKQTASARTESA